MRTLVAILLMAFLVGCGQSEEKKDTKNDNDKEEIQGKSGSGESLELRSTDPRHASKIINEE